MGLAGLGEVPAVAPHSLDRVKISLPNFEKVPENTRCLLKLAQNVPPADTTRAKRSVGRNKRIEKSGNARLDRVAKKSPFFWNIFQKKFQKKRPKMRRKEVKS